jgi:hypothetical protein
MLRELAQSDAAQVLEEARAGARARARAILEDALVDEILSALAGSGLAPGDGSGVAQHDQAARIEPTETPGPTEGTPAKPAEAGDAWWVYCVVRAQDATEAVTGLSGIEPDTSVDVLFAGELAALASRVPLPEYGDDQLRRNLEDIAWLERTARAHESVQEQVMRRTALVPLRLCTLYRDEAGVREALREKAGLFAQNLAAVEDCAEWGVKVFLAHGHEAANQAEQPAARAASGLEYLAGRQRERQLGAQADERGTRCAQEVHAAVSSLARLERINPAQHPEVHGRDAEMILNGAYLVEHAQAEGLQGIVARLAEEWAAHGLDVELTGPWPPYNFVSDSVGMIT